MDTRSQSAGRGHLALTQFCTLSAPCRTWHGTATTTPSLGQSVTTSTSSCGTCAGPLGKVRSHTGVSVQTHSTGGSSSRGSFQKNCPGCWSRAVPRGVEAALLSAGVPEGTLNLAWGLRQQGPRGLQQGLPAVALIISTQSCCMFPAGRVRASMQVCWWPAKRMRRRSTAWPSTR